MENSNEEVSRITDETPCIEGHTMDERKSQEIEKSCTKNEKEVLDDSSVASPVKQQKRKSELIVKSETKRIRSSDFMQKEICPDKSLIDISNNEKLQLENTDANSVTDCKSILDCTKSGEDRVGESSREFEKLSEKHHLDHADKVENKWMGSSGRKIKKELELSYNISLEMNKNTTDTNKAETSNTSRNAECIQSREVLAERKVVMFASPRSKEMDHRSIFGVPSISPQKFCSTTDFHPNNLIYEEPEFATSGYFPADTGFTNIMESSSLCQQQHSEENIKSEIKVKEKRKLSEKDVRNSSSSNVQYEGLAAILQENIALRGAVNFLQHRAEKLAQTSSQLMEFCENNPYFENNCTASEKTAAAKSDQETLESSVKAVNPKVFTKNQRYPIIVFTTADNSTVIPPATENPKSSTTENLKSSVTTPLSIEYKESGNSSKTDDLMFKEYPGIAEEPTKVKKDARYQKRFYKQKPVKLPISWKTNTDSSTEPEVNAEKDDKEQTERSGKDPLSLPRESDDEPLIIHENKQSPENDLPRTSGMRDTTDGYKLCSFMEESPTDSVDENNELVPSTSKNASVNTDDDKWLIFRAKIASMQSINSEISIPQNNPLCVPPNLFENNDFLIKTFTWTIVKYNTRGVDDGNCIFIRDTTNILPLVNSLTRPVRLKPYFKVVCYAEDRYDRHEFCIEEILKMFLECQEEVRIRDPQLELPSFEIPLPQVPLKSSFSVVSDNDYELVGDYLMRII